ncbi:MAG: copper-binding protein [Rhodocyclaceae bacterium]
MRPFAIAIIAALTLCGQAFANTPMANGVVKKLDKQKGNVVIAHGPLPNGMPGMTMPFRVKEPGWLDQLKEGQKIRFTIEEANGVMILQRYEVVK